MPDKNKRPTPSSPASSSPSSTPGRTDKKGPDVNDKKGPDTNDKHGPDMKDKKGPDMSDKKGSDMQEAAAKGGGGAGGSGNPSKSSSKPSIPGRDVGGEGPLDEKTGHGKAPEVGARDGGREQQDGPPHHDEPGRGSSIQGKHQDAKGGPMGANQGGAPRGGSRVEPSHTNQRAKEDRAGSKLPRRD